MLVGTRHPDGAVCLREFVGEFCTLSAREGRSACASSVSERNGPGLNCQPSTPNRPRLRLIDSASEGEEEEEEEEEEDEEEDQDEEEEEDQDEEEDEEEEEEENLGELDDIEHVADAVDAELGEALNSHPPLHIDVHGQVLVAAAPLLRGVLLSILLLVNFH